MQKKDYNDSKTRGGDGMSKRLGILLMTVILILSGCSGLPEKNADVSFSESEEAVLTTTAVADENESGAESQPVRVLQEQGQEVASEIDAPTVEVNDLVNERVNDSVPDQSSEEKEAAVSLEETFGQPAAESTSSSRTEPESSPFQEAETSVPEEPNPEVTTEEPEETVPEENREPIPETEQHQEESTEAKPAEEPESEPASESSFDIGYWISYAQDLAKSKGLKLDATATECWDNPITANASCIYLERDLNARLNRYAGDADITDVWIWYEDQGNGRYLIYIGYA